MSLLGERNVTRRRYGAFTTGADGRPARGALSSTTIRATGPQPLRGIELETLPEGERSMDWRKFYTEADVRTLSQHDQTPADEIVVDGVVYEVRSVQPQPAVIPHLRVEAVRVREG